MNGTTKTPGVRVWTAEERAAFLEAAQHDRLAGLWRLTAMTGMSVPNSSGCERVQMG